MNAELRATAAAIPIPVDHAGPARAYCTTVPGGYRVSFALDGGRRRELAGPTFSRPRDVQALADLLNGDPAPRSAPVIPAIALATTQPDQAPLEAPVPPLPVAARPDRTCVHCGGPIPPGSRSHRLTCSPACRVAHARAVARSADSGAALVTLSGPSAAEPAQLDLLPAH